MAVSLRNIALFRNDLQNETMLFCAPKAVVRADGPAELLPALKLAEAYLRDGLWVCGYISYEAGYLLDPALEQLLPPRRDCPLLVLGVFEAPVSQSPLVARDGPPPRLFNIRPQWSFADYQSRFEQLHQSLRQGDCYQGNLSFPIHADWEGDPLALFQLLTARQPVRYASFIDLGSPIILSRSPELFFEVSEDGWVETLPMKGTMPRGSTPAQDDALKEALRTDAKNQAENRMIVDLLRNDISRISVVGTLDVPELFKIESYPTVHQMVSRVRAKLLPNTSFGTIVNALFPGGSITGAPKISAMKILRALEPSPRGVYCGAIGWAAPDGRMRFNVAIRTISLFPQGNAIFNVGGGIVYDSTARSEYDECLLKARFAG